VTDRNAPGLLRRVARLLLLQRRMMPAVDDVRSAAIAVVAAVGVKTMTSDSTWGVAIAVVAAA
jgi:hypothetical protein